MKIILAVSFLFLNFLCRAQEPSPEQVAHDKTFAAKGDTAAMFHLGMYYCYGAGVPQDFAKAKEWLQKATDKGSTSAMLQLGMMYEDGTGVQKDPAKALALFRKGAQKGDAGAMNEMGIIYAEGIGVKKDMAAAVKNFKLAADHGSTEAMNSLALLYAKGEGIKKDVPAALQWLQKAADKGDVYAMTDLGVFYRSPELGNDCVKAMEWYMKARDMGDSTALPPVGEICLEGKCEHADLNKAAAWMKKHADEGDGDACFFMAAFYSEHIGVDVDYGKAIDMLTKDADILIRKNAPENEAIEQLFSMYDAAPISDTNRETILKWLELTADKTNDDGIMAGLGYIYTNKQNPTADDYAKAMTWSTRAADSGNATGYYNVGYLYANGMGVKKDEAKGFEWMMKGAEKGDKMAMQAVGDDYEKGTGVAVDIEKAAEWHERAKATPNP